MAWGRSAVVRLVAIAAVSCSDAQVTDGSDAGDAGARPPRRPPSTSTSNYPPKVRPPPPSDAGNTARGQCGTSCPKLLVTLSWSPQSLVVVDTGLAWTGNGVFSTGFDGLTMLTMAKDGSGRIAADSTHVFWGSYDVWSCPLTGCADPTKPQRIASVGAVGGLAVDATAVYFGGIATSSIHACPLAGCDAAPSVLAANVGTPVAVVRFGEEIFWMTGGSVGAIGACRVDACEATRRVVIAGIDRPVDFVVDASGVYWTDQVVANGSVTWRVHRLGTDGIVTELATGAGPSTLAVDDSDLYWGAADGWVVRCAKTGCAGKPTRVAQALYTWPSRLARAGANVYWTEGDGKAAIAFAGK